MIRFDFRSLFLPFNQFSSRRDLKVNVIEMWKFTLLLLTALLSNGDAQKLIIDRKLREGIEISDFADNVEAYQNTLTYRLPNNTNPESYVISLEFGDFHEDDMSFTGRVLITINVLENTNQITLHNSVLIVSVGLSSLTSNNNAIENTYDFDVEREFLIIKTAETLNADSRVQIDIAYRGNIGTSIAGIYRGSYRNEENDERCE